MSVLIIYSHCVTCSVHSICTQPFNIQRVLTNVYCNMVYELESQRNHEEVM